MIIYDIAIYFYALAVHIAAFFKKKAAKMVDGHKDVYPTLSSEIDKNAKYIWVHAASLGEFEQGSPIMEEIRRSYPEYKILLTFFSPSGYEIRKKTSLADIVCYLPFDTKRNVRKFIKLAQPKIAIFIKYEFWYNYINELHKQGIPTYMVSSIFRPNQIFFRWYGIFMRKMLKMYKCICVQNEESAQLLSGIGITNTVVCGDTRFDRVLDIKTQAKRLDVIERFALYAKKENDKILIAGSSWPKDEDIFIPFFNITTDLKLIVAPHEIDEAHLKYIEDSLGRPSIRYSQAVPEDIERHDCIIMDCIGLLSSIYHYGDIAYVGGGFGVGIHNIIEAAVYEIPVIFGPNFKKFREAQQLIEQGGGYSISDPTSFRCLMDEFMQYDETLQISGKHAGEYVKANAGAVAKVIQILNL